MKEYTVIVHFGGAIEYKVEANNPKEANQKAMSLFEKEDDKEIVNGISGYETEWYYEEESI